MAAEQNVSVKSDYSHDPNIKRQDFPDDFMFGVGTSAYQIEGAWRADGKGLNIWDTFALRHPEKIHDGSNGCVTIDFYHKMKEDVQLLKKMGLKYFRFSLSWSRILPGGKVSMGTNLEAIKFYNNLIDELKANDIEPFVTLFHWDVPNALEEEYMGFLSSRIVDDFANYAEICFWEFGDRVKHWTTLNEPYRFTYNGYVDGTYAPGRGGGEEDLDGGPETEPYTVAYNFLNSHAAVYRLYQEKFKSSQKGEVGITLDSYYFKPFSPKDSKDHANDVKAVEYALEFMLGLFLEPLTSGHWPKYVQTFGVTPSRHHPDGRVLPQFTDEEKKKLIQSYDFLGINYYSTNYAQYFKYPGLSKGFITDCHYKASGKGPDGKYIGEPAFPETRIYPKGDKEGIVVSPASWVYLCPDGLFDLLNYIKKKYKIHKNIVITENGAPQKNDDQKTYEQYRDDAYRLKYLKLHLDAIKRANSHHGKHFVKGYFYWSFTDSYEWNEGYTTRFGMNYVDFKNDLQRYPKNSAIWFKKFLSENKSGENRKRSRTEVDVDVDVDVEVEEEEEDEFIDEAPTKVQKRVEMVQKLKKAKN